MDWSNHYADDLVFASCLMLVTVALCVYLMVYYRTQR